MNYLIKLLKSNFLKFAATGSMTWTVPPQRGRRILRTSWCLSTAVFSEWSERSKRQQDGSNFLTNQRLSTSFTAGNAGRPRQRMRTLRIRGRVGKS